MKKIFEAMQFDKKDKHTYFLLLSAPILLTIYWYYGSANNFMKMLPELAKNEVFDFYAHVLQFVSFFVLMFIIPFLYVKLFMKKPLKELGFGLGDKKFGFALVAIVLPLLGFFMYFSTAMPDLQQEYPLAKILHQRHDLIFWYELAYVVFYYIAWEFFFRGFLLFGLKDRFGAFNAILIQTISSGLIHLGKPDGEMLGSILVGIVFGALALRCRSFWYIFIIHAFLGLFTDLFILLVHS